MSIGEFFGNLKKSVVKHSPELLIGAGIIGSVGAIILSVKATPKALDCIEEKKKEEKKEKLSVAETVEATWKCYVPAAITETVSIGCIVAGTKVSLSRTATLAAAYVLKDTQFNDYKTKVKEVIGEKKEESVKDAVAAEKIERNPVTSNQVIITGKGETLCYDTTFGTYFTSDIEKIRRVINDLNYNMRSEMFISVNELYYALGIPRIGIGDDLGWNIDKEGYIDIHFSSQLSNDGRPCLALVYTVGPRFDYRSLS